MKLWEKKIRYYEATLENKFNQIIFDKPLWSFEK